MYRNTIKVISIFALTIAILVGAFSLSATNIVFAADQSTKPASPAAPIDIRWRMCNLDGDRDNDDMCRVVGGRVFFGNGGYLLGNGYAMGNGYLMGNGYVMGNGYLLGNGYAMGNAYGPRNRYLLKIYDTDNDIAAPYIVGPYQSNYPWWWWR